MIELLRCLLEGLQAVGDQHRELRFEDGTEGIVPLADELFGPVFEPLKDVSFFERVGIDEFGAICWPNGGDLAPDALYDDV